jgi:KUP system potassium uptake protein
MKLSYFPQVKVVHTSKTYHGQLYVPVANWLLMVGTVVVAAVYNNTTSLGNAYGVCVMFVTFFDTCMVTLVAILVWRIKPYFVFLPWLIIACMDGTFLSSALLKVPDGAWFTILLATILASMFILWRFGKEQQWFAEAEDRFPTTHFVKTNDNGDLQLTDLFGGKILSRAQGFGIFFDKAGETTPIIFSQFIRKLVTAPEVIVFFHLRPLDQPSVAPSDRYSVTHIVSRALDREGESTSSSSSSPPAAAGSANSITAPSTGSTSSRLEALERAFNHEVLYVIGKEQMKVKKGTNWGRRAVLEVFLWLRENTRAKVKSLEVPMDKVIEIGFVKDV